MRTEKGREVFQQRVNCQASYHCGKMVPIALENLKVVKKTAQNYPTITGKVAEILILQFPSVHSWEFLRNVEVINFSSTSGLEESKMGSQSRFPIYAGGKKNLRKINVKAGRWTEVETRGKYRKDMDQEPMTSDTLANTTSKNSVRKYLSWELQWQERLRKKEGKEDTP